MYCKKCGGKIESYASHCPFCGEPIANNSVQSTYTTAIPAQTGRTNKGVGGWILTSIICGIPLIGIIMLFVWEFGEKTKSDLTFRNWARAQLVVMLIAIVPVILLFSALTGALLAA